MTVFRRRNHRLFRASECLRPGLSRADRRQDGLRLHAGAGRRGRRTAGGRRARERRGPHRKRRRAVPLLPAAKKYAEVRNPTTRRWTSLTAAEKIELCTSSWRRWPLAHGRAHAPRGGRLRRDLSESERGADRQHAGAERGSPQANVHRRRWCSPVAARAKTASAGSGYRCLLETTRRRSTLDEAAAEAAKEWPLAGLSAASVPSGNMPRAFGNDVAARDMLQHVLGRVFRRQRAEGAFPAEGPRGREDRRRMRDASMDDPHLPGQPRFHAL